MPSRLQSKPILNAESISTIVHQDKPNLENEYIIPVDIIPVDTYLFHLLLFSFTSNNLFHFLADM